MRFFRLGAIVSLILYGSVALSPWQAAAKSDQTKPHTTARKHPPAAAKDKNLADVARLLAGTGYKYVMRKPGVWTVEFAGKKLGRSLVVVTSTSKLVVMFTIVGASAAVQKTPPLMQALLRANSTFDYVKIGFDHDGDLFVRLDAPVRVTDARQLKTDLEQVMSASDELYGQIGQFIKR